MNTEFPITTFQGNVSVSWVDENRHMTSMAYVSLFWSSLGGFFAPLGITAAYMSERKLSIFQREAHLSWERELLADDPITVRSWLIGHNAKRIHHFHELWHAGDGYRAASMEYLSFHIDLEGRRAAPFPADIQARLEAMATGFKGLPRPQGVGAAISLSRPRTVEPAV